MTLQSKFLFVISDLYFVNNLRNLLRDGLKVANAQDLNGVTALTLLMLGYTYQRSDSGVEVNVH